MLSSITMSTGFVFRGCDEGVSFAACGETVLADSVGSGVLTAAGAAVCCVSLFFGAHVFFGAVKYGFAVISGIGVGLSSAVSTVGDGKIGVSSICSINCTACGGKNSFAVSIPNAVTEQTAVDKRIMVQIIRICSDGRLKFMIPFKTLFDVMLGLSHCGCMPQVLKPNLPQSPKE